MVRGQQNVEFNFSRTSDPVIQSCCVSSKLIFQQPLGRVA